MLFRNADDLRAAVRQYYFDHTHRPYGPIGTWDVSRVDDMDHLFRDLVDFNESLDGWNVGQVQSMVGMFQGCEHFQQPLGNWNVGNVKRMRNMFLGCRRFDQPLGHWNVGQVEDMRYMFCECVLFNQPLASWNVGRVQLFSGMFANCTHFNHPLGDWNLSRAHDLHSMFYDCVAFNQPLSAWVVSEVVDMNSMFRGCSSFNQRLDDWDVTYDADIENIFDDCPQMAHHLPWWVEWHEPIFPKVVLKKRAKKIALTEDTVAQDVIEGEVKVLAFLRQDPAQHFVLHFLGKFYTFHRDQVPIRDADLLLICKKPYKRLTVTEDMLEDKTTIYYHLKKLGLYGMCLASQFQTVLASTGVQHFSVEATVKREYVVASYELFIHYGDDATSRAHCQEGSTAQRYEIKTFAVKQAQTRKRRSV
jgi:surface protein